MNTFIATINGIDYYADEQLQDFKLFAKPSSYVAFYGTNRNTNQLFVQYTNGNCVMFEDIADPILAKAEVAPSIGKFLHTPEIKSATYTQLPINDMIFDEDERLNIEEADEDFEDELPE